MVPRSAHEIEQLKSKLLHIARRYIPNIQIEVVPYIEPAEARSLSASIAPNKILFSREVMELASWEHLRELLLQEIARLLNPYKAHPEGESWAMLARSLGAELIPHAFIPLRNTRYKYTCATCGWTTVGPSPQWRPRDIHVMSKRHLTGYWEDRVTRQRWKETLSRYGTYIRE
jgi:hypothetical protein